MTNIDEIYDLFTWDNSCSPEEYCQPEQQGLELAKAIKALLPQNIELYYFSLKEPIWKVRPEETNDGGLFNEGEPIKID